MASQHTVFGLYRTTESAEQAVASLRRAAFAAKEISLENSAVGGMAETLIRSGLPEYEARRYEGFVKEGQTLISVNAGNGIRVKHVRHVLKESGALEIRVADEPDPPTYYTGKSRQITRADDYQFRK